VLVPQSAQALDDTNVDANFAIDNNPTTDWTTQFYDNNAVFGGLKNGSGLILNMGHAVKLSSVTVTFGPEPGANVQIKLGTPAGPVPPPSSSPSTGEAWADSMTTVSQQNNVAAGSVTFSVNSQASGQYVLIWFTKLPPLQGSPNKFEADIFNVVVKGSS